MDGKGWRGTETGVWGREGLYDVEEWEKIGSNSEKMYD
jgi:hypothetical protein